MNPSKLPPISDLIELPATFSVIRLPPDADPPSNIDKGCFFSMTKTHDELSVVGETQLVSESELKAAEGRQEKGWKGLKLQGPIDFNLTGVLSSVLNPLAAKQVGIFAISTFDTDYIFVMENHYSRAKSTLESAGFQIRLTTQ